MGPSSATLLRRLDRFVESLARALFTQEAMVHPLSRIIFLGLAVGLTARSSSRHVHPLGQRQTHMQSRPSAGEGIAANTTDPFGK